VLKRLSLFAPQARNSPVRRHESRQHPTCQRADTRSLQKAIDAQLSRHPVRGLAGAVDRLEARCRRGDGRTCAKRRAPSLRGRCSGRCRHLDVSVDTSGAATTRTLRGPTAAGSTCNHRGSAQGGRTERFARHRHCARRIRQVPTTDARSRHYGCSAIVAIPEGMQRCTSLDLVQDFDLSEAVPNGDCRVFWHYETRMASRSMLSLISG